MGRAHTARFIHGNKTTLMPNLHLFRDGFVLLLLQPTDLQIGNWSQTASVCRVCRELNAHMISTCSHLTTLFAFRNRVPFYPGVWLIFSQIKTRFKDPSASDLVVSGEWRAHADRPVAGLSVGARWSAAGSMFARIQYTPSHARQSEHLRPATGH